MKIFVDNQIANILAHDADKLLKNPFICDPDNHITFRWPALFEYLGLGSIFSKLPAFDHTQSLFKACISILYAHEEKEVLFHMYDHLFVENLNQIKALPQIEASFLIQAIKKQREKPSYLEVEKVLSASLGAYEAALAQEAASTMHDLILYLAWDRMCVCMAQIFNYQSTDPKFLEGIDILKDCLIESYQHIAQQGRTSPGIYRMLESLFFYQMREENIQKHTDAEWTLLSQSFPALKPQNELADFFYIDDAVFEENAAYYLTLDSPDSVNSRLALTQYMMDKLKMAFQPKKIVYLNIE